MMPLRHFEQDEGMPLRFNKARPSLAGHAQVFFPPGRQNQAPRIRSARRSDGPHHSANTSPLPRSDQDGASWERTMMCLPRSGYEGDS